MAWGCHVMRGDIISAHQIYEGVLNGPGNAGVRAHGRQWRRIFPLWGGSGITVCENACRCGLSVLSTSASCVEIPAKSWRAIPPSLPACIIHDGHLLHQLCQMIIVDL